MEKLKKLLFITVIMFCFTVSAVTVLQDTTVTVEAATKKKGWVKQGKYRYYYVNGKKVQNAFRTIGGKRYFFRASDGRMVTYRKKIGKYYYIFDKKGVMITNKWVKRKGVWHYQNGKGYSVVNRWFTKGGKKYYFNETGAMKKGFIKVGQNTYYLNPKKTIEKGKTYPEGCMCTGWVKIKGKWYYFRTGKSAGKMHKGWLTKNGKKYYLKSNGVMKTGWHTEKGKRYYLNVPNGEMVVNTTKVINNVAYAFDSKGVATKQKYSITSSGTVKVWDGGRGYYLKKEYISHPGVANGKLSNDELMAAVLYCEAGDQGLAGMTAVALTIYNRVESNDPYYPDTLKYVIYQVGQYEVVSDGSLLRRLRNPKGETYSTCKKAVANAKKIMSSYRAGSKKRVISGISTKTMGRKDFDCLYFMTKYSFNSLNLSWSKCKAFQYKDHVFFSKWVTN